MRLERGSPNTINEHPDAWWLKLGARLRDIPGREFPQLPERTAQALLTLWNEALEGAQETLRGSIAAWEGDYELSSVTVDSHLDDEARGAGTVC